MIRKVVNDFFEAGQLAYGAAGTAFLVEALLDRGTEGDVAEAQSAIDRAAKLPADEGLVLRDDHAAAAARPAGPGPRRRRRLPRLGESLPRDGGIASASEGHIAMARIDDVRWGSLSNSVIPLMFGSAHTGMQFLRNPSIVHRQLLDPLPEHV